MRFANILLVLCVVSAWQANAQKPTWDSSGNGMLNGTYYFREVIYTIGDQSGDLTEATSVYGTMSFNGAGSYSLAGTYFDSGGAYNTYTASGTYTFGANGYGFFTGPLASVSSSISNWTEYGLVGANGVLVASMTENGFNDMFIAAPIGTQATNGNFSGSYTVSAFFPSGTVTDAADATFQLNPNGAGSLGNVTANGYFAAGGSTVYTQNLSNIAYSFSNGAGVLKFPTTTSSTAYFFNSGQEYMYISGDRNFIFGGNPQGFDMFVGVKNNASGTTPNFGGIYYEAGIDQDASTLASDGYAALDSYYGSYNVTNGNIVGHERLFTPLYDPSAEGVTYASTYPSTISNSAYTDPGGDTQYTFGNGSQIRIGFGVGPTLGISVGVQAPTVTPSTSVFLNPMGITNAASFAPFTAGVSPGEFIVLYGTNLAAKTVVASTLPFPQSLGGVSVTVDGLSAPIYYVSPTQISIIVPYSSSFYPLASIQVNNNGSPSNTITPQVNLTTPGIFTLAANGLGDGAIEHANGSVVTESNPAQPGETIAVYTAGLGAVFPPVTEGTAGSATTLSNTTNTFTAYIGGAQATVAFAGYAPYLAGVYQMNITIPSTATAGDNLVEVIGPDSDNFEAYIPVGSGSASASARPPTAAHALVRHTHRKVNPSFAPHPLPAFGAKTGGVQ